MTEDSREIIDLAWKLRSEALAEEIERFERDVWGEDRSDCGGQTLDPPCGACHRCVVDQLCFYFPSVDTFLSQARLETP